VSAPSQAEDLSYRLSRITQLTGLADPVYAEAFVTVHQYDIVLDVLVINQTGAAPLRREPQMSVGENRHVPSAQSMQHPPALGVLTITPPPHTHTHPARPFGRRKRRTCCNSCTALQHIVLQHFRRRARVPHASAGR
jgi:hypothetical protein